ncbi:Exodeoxyribonuclease 7 large subunit [Rickettsiales endosymbiont of Paramecium tredecaurelia]|uniref:exodeoxyribonuclease VII large subunit n=1 Tax=Candidatus Sarmatiella mevalonica TaxID=2770581 RepID=UPI001922A0F6|nr:exodeoxyribonuclease VII large subunit [Candidatus Sarmatiella mevalonica]MBL3284772.1 Exodeoxyribonuclease 7 large subunit [Candidatus Sarmatiella mevalonica]
MKISQALSELTELSVTQLSNSIKNVLVQYFSYVRVRGEVSNLKIASSGHVYFKLKDQKALISCVCWKGNWAKLKFHPKSGDEVSLIGKVTTYSDSSEYQLDVNLIDPSGVGYWMQLLEERKTKLQAQGVFAPEHKKPIPFISNIIGVITSSKGSVIEDIKHRIMQRFPTKICLYSVPVQGEQTAPCVIEAVQYFNNLPAGQRPDVLIIARGGGSIEELWPFNDEALVLATFASNIPIISAIGHETDYTLLDLVADVRAPTPTAAAEFVTPVLKDLRETIYKLNHSLILQLEMIINLRSAQVKGVDLSIDSFLNEYQQRVDRLEQKLEHYVQSTLYQKTIAINKVVLNDRLLTLSVDGKKMKLEVIAQKLNTIFEAQWLAWNNKIQNLSDVFSALDYQKILQRGFVIVRGEQDEQIITSSKDIVGEKKLILEFFDGQVVATTNVKK